MPRIPTLITKADGTVEGINPRRLAEIPFFFLINAPNNAVTIPARQASPPFVITVSGEGSAQIYGIGRDAVRAGVSQANADARVFLQIQDGQAQRGLMNGAVHVDTIMGGGPTNPFGGIGGGLPYRFAEGLYLDEARSLVVSYTNLNAVDAVAIRAVPLAQRFLTQNVDYDLTRIRSRLERRQYLSVPYWYTLDQEPPSVAAGATARFTITVGQDHHFKFSKLSRVVTETGNIAISGPWDVDIRDISTGESIIGAPQSTSFPISGELVFGSGQFPRSLYVPRMIQAGMKLEVTLVNRHSQPQTFHLTLGGQALALRMWK